LSLRGLKSRKAADPAEDARKLVRFQKGCVKGTNTTRAFTDHSPAVTVRSQLHAFIDFRKNFFEKVTRIPVIDRIVFNRTLVLCCAVPGCTNTFTISGIRF
jgi:hypothetical protein